MARFALITALACLLLVQAFVPASAAAARDASQLHRMLAADRGQNSTATFAASAEYTDAEGDETELQSRNPADEDRVDILRHTVNYTSNALRLTVDVGTPTDPLTSPAWQQNTLLGWFLDVDDNGEGDFFLDYSLTITGPEAIEVLVQPVADDGTAGQNNCGTRARGTFDGTSYIAVIPSDCIGNPAQVAAGPGMLFQEDGNAITYNDFAPNTGNFEAPVAVSEGANVDRLSGASRLETAVAISQFQFPDGAEVVYIARSDVLADAIAGGVLTDGPILLVPTCGPIPQFILDEIVRLDPGSVVALGGTAAVCDQVLADAGAEVDAETSRLRGPTRIETSVAISQFQFPMPGSARDVYLARQDIFADAVAGGVLTNGPILLIPTCDGVPQVVEDEISRLMPVGVYALGGTAAICDANLNEAAAASLLVQTTGRLSGPTRVDTAVAISQFQFPDGADTVYLARQDVLADAVSAGSLTGGPVLLVSSCGDLAPAVVTEIQRVGATQAFALGGTAAICDDVLLQAAEAIDFR